MRKCFKCLIGFAFTGSLFLTFTSCGNSEQNITEGVEYYPVKLEDSGKWGMVSPSGEMLFEEEFESQPTPVFDGLFVVEEGRSISIYTASKKPELVIDGLEEAGFLSDGVIPTTTKNSRITMIDRYGKNKFTLMPHNGKEIVLCDAMYFDGLLRIKDEDDKWGYADNLGKIVISPKYAGCTPFSEGFALALIENGGKYETVIIDKKGEQIAKLKDDIEFTKSSEYGFKNGLLIAKRNDNFGFINTKGEFKKVSGKVDGISEYNEELFTFKDKDGKWGVMAFDETQLIRCKYSSIKILSSGDFLVTNEGKTYVINKADEKIVDLDDYTCVYALSGAFNFAAKEGGNYYLFLNQDGKPINKSEYAKIGSIHLSKVMEEKISSDFFDIEGVSQLISESINEKGIGNNTIGTPMSKYVKNPNDYSSVYVYSVTDSTSSKEGWRYSIKVDVSSDSPILQYGKNPEYGYTDYGIKEINPSAIVNNIELTAQVKDGTSKEITEKVIDSLTQKGFEKTSEDTLTKGNTEIYINASNDYRIRIKMRLTESDAILNP